MTLRTPRYIGAEGAEEQFFQVTWKGRRGWGVGGLDPEGGSSSHVFCSNASLSTGKGLQTDQEVRGQARPGPRITVLDHAAPTHGPRPHPQRILAPPVPIPWK